MVLLINNSLEGVEGPPAVPHAVCISKELIHFMDITFDIYLSISKHPVSLSLSCALRASMQKDKATLLRGRKQAPKSVKNKCHSW